MAQAIQQALSRIDLSSVAESVARSGIRMSWVRIELALMIGAFIMAA